MLRRATAIVLVTLLSTFMTPCFCHDQKDPVLTDTAGHQETTQQPVLSEKSISQATRQESSAVQDAPSPDTRYHQQEQQSHIKEAGVVSSQVPSPETKSEPTPVPGQELTVDKVNDDSIKKEAEPTDPITSDNQIQPGAEKLQVASAGELSSERRKESEETVSVTATRVLHTDVSITLTKTATPTQQADVKTSVDLDEQLVNSETQGEVTSGSVPSSQDKGENSDPMQADDTLQDVKEFIKEAAEMRNEEKPEEDNETVSGEKEAKETVTSESSHDIELPSVEIPESVPGTQPEEVKGPEVDKAPADGDGKGEDVKKDGSESGEVTQETQEEFPSFGEWTAKVLAEEEKTKLEQGSLGNMPGGAVQQKSVKQSRNNYASRDCGAKILGANREAQNTNSILNGNKDDYMTNPCTAKKWFIVELCEPIQVRTFELASFELFSSQPRTFKVHLSDRYPTKDWRLVGTFHATEERSTHSYQVEDEHFSKFVKVEMVEHFKEEHFCPLTLFRVFGVDLNYMTDEEEGGHDEITNSQDPDTGDLLLNDEDGQGNPTNLFESAKDTVISLVKKVLKVEDREKSEQEANELGETGNGTELESGGNNTTEDGYLLPCIPEVSIPSDPDADNKSVTNSTEKEGVLPEEPYPQTTPSKSESDTPVVRLSPSSHPTCLREQLKSLDGRRPKIDRHTGFDGMLKSVYQCHGDFHTIKKDPASVPSDDNLVIKLQDHEQPPSPDRLTEPLVTLIDWNYLTGMGNKELALSCSRCSHGNRTRDKSTTDGRKHCLYINLLLGNLQQRHSCPAKKPKRTKTPESRLKEAGITEDVDVAITSQATSALNDIEESLAEEKKLSTETQEHIDHTEEITSSSSKGPNVVVATSTLTTSATKSLPSSESSASHTLVDSSVTSDTLVSHSEISIVEEPISSASKSQDAGSSVEPTRVVTEKEDVTMYPQPGQVIIPTATSEVKDASVARQAESNDLGEVSSNNNKKKKEELQIVELESSFDGTLVSKKSMSHHDLSESSTPELPPLNGDGTVSLSSSDGDKVNIGDGTLQQQNGGQIDKAENMKDVTEPPAEVTRDTTLVQPTPVEDPVTASQDDKVVKAINQSEARSGEEGKRDLNLVRVPVSPHLKRETAIMRLNNRLKALELNVSLSSRFLEELSKRYRKQSDDVMKLLNKTMSRLSNTTKLVEEKDQQNRHLIGQLEARIDNLTSIVTKLADSLGYLDQKLSERNFTWATMEVVVVLVLLMMSLRRSSSPAMTPEVQKLLENMPMGPGPPKQRRRRNSSTGTVGYSSPQPPLIKHSSESALDVHTDFSIVEPLVTAVCSDIKMNEGNKKKKKRKHKNLESKSSVYNGMKEATPSSSSSSNHSSGSSPGAFNGLGKVGPDIEVGCQLYKPRSNSQSGPMNSQQTACVNGERHSDNSGGSSTSVASVHSEKDGTVVVKKCPLKLSHSVGCSHAASFQAPAPVKISKSVSAKGLASANINKNACSKKSKEQWHCRAQSDGNVIVDPRLGFWSAAGKMPPDGAVNRRRSTAADEVRPPLPLVSHAPETLGVFNGTASPEQITVQPASNQPEKGKKWPGGWKNIISIK